MHYYVVTGDILKGFSVTIESEEKLTEEDLDSEKLGEIVAKALELKRYQREEGLNLQSLEEVGEHGCELESTEEET